MAALKGLKDRYVLEQMKQNSKTFAYFGQWSLGTYQNVLRRKFLEVILDF